MTETVDVAVIGGGPAGISAALWAARYRRRVVLVDAGEQRNRWTEAAHGYLGFEAAAPADLLRQLRTSLERYPEVQLVRCAATDAQRVGDAFRISLSEGPDVVALRLVLATGVRDLFPPIADFERFYGRAVFTCPSCDGYEAQGRTVAVIGEPDHMAPFAIGLLDWAASVVIVDPRPEDGAVADEHDRLGDVGVDVVRGVPAALVGTDGSELTGIRLADGRTVACDIAFCTMAHEQHSDLPVRLGCAVSVEGCVCVDEHGRTSVEHVYAAGDMTPGPHLVQVAAAKGAVAGIAAAMSLRGEQGVRSSPTPAPEAEDVLAT